MDFAFSLLLLIILLFPGIVTFQSYYRGDLSKIYVEKSLTEKLFSGFVLAFIIHIIFYLLFLLFRFCFNGLFSSLLDYSIPTVNFYTYGILLNPGVSINLFEYRTILQNHIVPYLGEIALYFLSIYSFSFLIGYCTYQLKDAKKWDLKTNFWRTSSPWYYLVSGDVIFTKEESYRYQRILELLKDRSLNLVFAGTFLTTLIQLNDKTYLYKGYICKYYIDKTGNIERIVLFGVQRKLLDPVSNINYPYQLIEGDFFSIDKSEMMTYNFIYLFEDLNTGNLYNANGEIIEVIQDENDQLNDEDSSNQSTESAT